MSKLPQQYLATTINITIDGQTVSSIVNDILPHSSTFSLQFRGSKNLLSYSVGFNEVGLWNRALTESEKISLYNNGSGVVYPFDNLGGSGQRIVSGIQLLNSGSNYYIAPEITIDAPTGGGTTATAFPILTPDYTKLYADSYPGLSVGNTDYVITGMNNGTGYFNIGKNDFIRVGNTIDFYDWTAFLNFNPTGIVTGVSRILLSTMDNVNQTSGFMLGINDSNRLFFEYVGDNTRNIKIHNQELGTNNIVSIALDKTHSSLTINNHNFAKQESYSFAYNIPSYTHSNILYFGGFPNSGDNSKYTGFIGTIGDFLLVSGAMNSNQTDLLAPVFFVTGFQPQEQVFVNTPFSIMTGANFLNKVISTGVTGYSLGAVSIPDKDGSNITIYDLLTQQGEITGMGVEYLYGTSTGIRTSLSGIDEQLYWYSNFLKKYTEPNLVLINTPVATGDLMEVYSFDDKWVGKISIMPDYFNLHDYYLTEDYANENLNVYHEGLLQATGIDYTVTSGKIVSNNLYGYHSLYSLVLYDEVSGTTLTSGWTGCSGAYTIGGNQIANGTRDIYLNGQKLISGFDYTVTGKTPF